jgi:hypothetical protein
MSKREEQRLAALLRKHAGKARPPRQDRSAQYDDTLRTQPPEDNEERERFFKEMKRREF